MRRLLVLAGIAMLAGCAATGKPAAFLDAKVVWRNDRGSDWMLRPDREWINERNNPRLQGALGLEWPHQIDCPFIATGTDALKWVHLGCAWRFGKRKPGRLFGFCGDVALIHQVDELSSWWLRTDKQHVKPPSVIAQQYRDTPGAKWTGQNPFYHLRAGLCWDHKIRCPMIATGRSMFQGAPFESEDNAPDLYWSALECGKRWGGLN